jgi:hypothetical protein
LDSLSLAIARNRAWEKWFFVNIHPAYSAVGFRHAVLKIIKFLILFVQTKDRCGKWVAVGI